MMAIAKKKVLFLGLNPPNDDEDTVYLHYPVIAVSPLPASTPEIQVALSDISHYTHVIFTSKIAVRCFLDLVDASALERKTVISVGKATSAALEKLGVAVDYTADLEQAEGVIALLESVALGDAYVFWPHSSKARSVIPDYLKANGIHYRATVIYETVAQKLLPVPSLSTVDEIVFTSPSTVEGFIAVYGTLPKDKTLTAIGPITRAALDMMEKRT